MNTLIKAIASFGFLGIMGVTFVNNPGKQETTYLLTDACGKVYVQRGAAKPPEKNSWRWNYTRVCAFTKILNAYNQ